MKPVEIAIIGIRALEYPAGIDHYVTEVVRRIASPDCRVTVFCQSPYVRAGVEKEWIRVASVPTFKNIYLGTPVYALLSSLAVVFTKAKIVHYHGLGSALFSFIPRLAGKKTVVTIHAVDWEGKKWGRLSKTVLKLSAWIAFKTASAVTVVSKVTAKYFEEHYHEASVVIPNGASVVPPRSPDLIRKYGLDKDNYILFLGRLVAGKGCEFLVEAYNKLDTNLKLVIAGDAISEHGYVRWIKALAKKDVIFTGFVEGELKEELLSNARMFVQPSELEGMSGVLLEAMAHGRCVVASDISQNREVLNDAGFYFSNGSAEDLEAKLNALITDGDAMAKKGEAARLRVKENYSWDSIAGRWLDLYSSMRN